jgi:hypothetical protein
MHLTGYSRSPWKTEPKNVQERCVYVPVILKPFASRISVIRNAAATGHQYHSDVLKETPSLCVPNAALPKLIIVSIIVTLFYAAIRSLIQLFSLSIRHSSFNIVLKNVL